MTERAQVVEVLPGPSAGANWWKSSSRLLECGPASSRLGKRENSRSIFLCACVVCVLLIGFVYFYLSFLATFDTRLIHSD